jgi:hypothetical protein
MQPRAAVGRDDGYIIQNNALRVITIAHSTAILDVAQLGI